MSIKDEAQAKLAQGEQALAALEQTGGTALAKADVQATGLLTRLFRVVNDVDIEAAEARVASLKAKYPNESPEEIVQRLVADKCAKTGTIGAVTSGAGLIPGIGTAAAMTVGVAADIGATFKLEAELVLEIAAAYDYPLTEEEKQRIVMLITGLSTGATTLATRAGQSISVRLTEQVAETAFLKALPVIGIIASASTNALATYVIGQRADAYFRHGPEAVGTWSDSLRALSGLDERKVTRWVATQGREVGDALVTSAKQVRQAGQATGQAVVSGVTTTGLTIGGTIKAVFLFIWSWLVWVLRKLTGRAPSSAQQPPADAPSPSSTPNIPIETTSQTAHNDVQHQLF